ncbi:TOTE conflict system archaeo-eukaryotic primase domain-containing protein [Microlunatus parietis]|uniref:TOTE conflict system primase domain-containing protein n=1 Tax=Microlunatus parietis TaxID=682979 RepID=A0A7Y9IBP9_9ACTN|nr:hypothetical protein [Microlunatus parietis]NYE73961.1 hypothetical protein [Microlunatus parietis]
MEHAIGVGPTDDVAQLRRELDRLRAENRRLSRLLELRGQDTEPGPEQLAAPVDRPGMVTMASPADRKLALFASLFRARTDVYSLRWENHRTGRSGWKPAVAGGWRKGMNSATARRLPLTQEVLAAHLTGDEFIGLYPLQRDNSCSFLAADFDGPSAMLDALAYVKAGRAREVPVALEISQSGRGAHGWIFFAESTPAVIARGVGTVLIHDAMTLRGSMDLRSYDRLFPSQDVLPDGGFGNLIAAPLNGLRRRNSLTVFLDLATLEPFDDQWDYLSTVDRLGPSTARKVARLAERTVVGAEVTRLDSSPATKIKPQLPKIVTAELAAGLRLSAGQLTPAAVSTFKHAASMINPKFYELQRLRKST